MMVKTVSLVVLLTLSFAGCTSNEDSPTLNSGRTDITQIQQEFRENILSNYMDDSQEELFIADAPSIKDENVKDINNNPEVSSKNIEAKNVKDSPEKSSKDSKNQKVEISPALKAWRNQLSEEWSAIGDRELEFLCKFFYEGMVDEASGFASLLMGITQQLERQGTKVYSITNIEMREDNRKTIELPTAQYSSALFVCTSKIIFELSNGNYSPPVDSTLSLIYYLSDGQRLMTFNFKANN